MALQQVARTLGRTGLAKLLEKVPRPAGIVLLDSAPHLGTASNGGQLEASNAEASFSGEPALRPANASGFSAFSVTVSAQLRTFASAAVEEVSAADDKGSGENRGEAPQEPDVGVADMGASPPSDNSVEGKSEPAKTGSRATKRRKARRIARRAKQAEIEGGKPPNSPDGRPNWGRDSADNKYSMREKKRTVGPAKDALLQLIRQAAPDADLDELLADGKAGKNEIDGKVVQLALYGLANEGDTIGSGLPHLDEENEDDRESSSNKLGRSLNLLDWWQRKDADNEEQECGPNDALRALNLFEWWQKKNAGAPQVWLLNPLLKALARGEHDTQIQALWETYKASAKYDDRLIADFLQAFYNRGRFEEVLATHKEVVDNKWTAVHKANDFALLALLGQGAPADEAWQFYKQFVEKSGQGLHNQRCLVALLESGVSVEQIRSLEYKEPDRVAHRLIQALCKMGRRDEAGLIVKELVEREQPEMPLTPLVSILSTMVATGFKEEAQKLVDLRAQKSGLQLDHALGYVIRNRKNAWSGVSAYRALMELEGPHRKSLPVQAAMIAHVYFPLRKMDAMLRAYKLGKTFEGRFHAAVVGKVIYALALENRAAEAETILAEFYESKEDAPMHETLGMLPESMYHRLFEMYLRAEQPDKAVNVVRGMVEHKYYVKEASLNNWAERLRNAGFATQAEQVEIAGEDMKAYRPKFERPGERYKGRTYLHKSKNGKVTGGKDERGTEGGEKESSAEGGEKEVSAEGGEKDQGTEGEGKLQSIGVQ
ncbi:hypothetical protein KFL_007070010 [Klebsormidium nitens]|uniref:Uncharacterized protein n=1 Tax=Klebsormidium nitens TaxID=105231 RepID=A0A1Y1IJJ4_KLENI|nr:hypothetical protein KFL_007070010 [Klebsormidium nitens]|eukprot:GAQ90954.1 hypothetical protein KFL_007070010 [Klebsormidium nitens]